ncbi:hypothetical protein VaNZ11_015613 [Volvox africanus]|uniref:C2 domain-containing protein n=1 Tax=Volvox africanus TaxID=51714 RepID=A0ABQ5SLX7_9CHLO|nr:hypothetical protein VaNZ11_015613 [Volvox africanus]
MALCPGVVSVTIEFAEGLKDHDFIFRQSPYCIVSVGAQIYRTQVASQGGRNPVWNETFQFNVCNENDLVIEVKDCEVGRDPNLGTAVVNLSRVRQMGQDRQQVPVISPHHQTQHGLLSVALSFQPEMYGGMMMAGQQQLMYGDTGMMGGMQQPMYGGAGMMGPQPGVASGLVVVEEEVRPNHHHHHHHHHQRGGENVEVVFVEREQFY